MSTQYLAMPADAPPYVRIGTTPCYMSDFTFMASTREEVYAFVERLLQNPHLVGAKTVLAFWGEDWQRAVRPTPFGTYSGRFALTAVTEAGELISYHHRVKAFLLLSAGRRCRITV